MWREGGEMVFYCPCPAHHGPEHLDVIGAVVVVHDDHGDEEKFLTEVVCPENLRECFSNLFDRIPERTCTDRGDNQVLDPGLAGCCEDCPPQPTELVIEMPMVTCLLLVAKTSCGSRDQRKQLGVGEAGEVAGLVPT